jgi:hypothetical protein
MKNCAHALILVVTVGCATQRKATVANQPCPYGRPETVTVRVAQACLPKGDTWVQFPVTLRVLSESGGAITEVTTPREHYSWAQLHNPAFQQRATWLVVEAPGYFISGVRWDNCSAHEYVEVLPLTQLAW